MVFEKKYRKSTLNNIVICTQHRNCQQLHLSWGINFSSNENFKACKSNLKDKVRLSFFATRRYPSRILKNTTHRLKKDLSVSVFLTVTSRKPEYPQTEL